MKILIVGGGAIGAFYGGMLSQAGAKVSVLCRSNYDIVKKYGFQIKSELRNFIFYPEQIINDIRLYQGDLDYIIITTKVLPEDDIPKLIRPIVKPTTAIVLLQNGIHIEKPYVKSYPNNEIISGLAFVCVGQPSPGQIHHQDYGKLNFGNIPEGVSHKITALCDMFKAVGLDAKVSEDISMTRWKKLIWNAAYNPISVLAEGITTQNMMGSDVGVDLIKKIMKEVFILAEIDGHPLNHDVIQQNLEATRKMTPYKTSMLQDYEKKKPLEIEAILGNALRFANEHSVQVPYIETLYALLKLKTTHHSVN